MVFVTTLFVLITMGTVMFVTQALGDARLVVDSILNPVKLVGQVRMKLVPERRAPSCGVLAAGSERLNTVP